MKLAELIRTNNWLSIELTLLEIYPDQIDSIDAYKRVYENLQFIEIEESEITIELEQGYDDETGGKSMVDVSGAKKINDENAITNSLAIEFVPWKEWLGMTISENTFTEFNELEIIAHCLYEMTFMGYDEEEIQDQLSNIKGIAEEYENMTDEEKKANTKSLDDLLGEKVDE